MKKWSGFLGLVGLLVLLFGVAGWYEFGLRGSAVFLKVLVLGHLILGTALVVLWLITRDWHQVSVGRSTRFGINAVVYSLLFAALLAALNWLANRYDRRWDLTEEGVYSLAPQSRKIVEGLKKPLKLVAFKGNQFMRENQVRDLFELYEAQNRSKVTAEVVDPRTKPHLLETYEMKPGNLVYIEYGEGDKKQVSRLNEFSEEAITNAILKLTRGEAKKIYYVTGHGEPSLQDGSPRGLKAFHDAVGDEHLTLEEIVLGEKGAVPDDAAAVIVVSPVRPLLAAEKELLINYVEKGGRLLLMTDPRRPPDIAEVAEHFGITVDKNLVVDIVQRLFAAPALGAKILAHEYGFHAVTRNLREQDPVIFDMAVSVRPKSSSKDGGLEKPVYTELVKSGPNAWGETNLALVFDAAKPSASREEDDIKGPVALAVAYEKKLSDGGKSKEQGDNQVDSVAGEREQAEFEKAGRLVVFGDSDWITNDGLGYYANRDLVLNTINWLVGEEGGITIRPRAMKASSTLISRSQYLAIFGGSLLIPELILILGMLVWWRRKSS